jgi:hypothetical protein
MQSEELDLSRGVRGGRGGLRHEAYGSAETGGLRSECASVFRYCGGVGVQRRLAGTALAQDLRRLS